MTGWLILLAVLILLGFIPLGVSVAYNAEGFVVKAIAGCIRFTVFPFPSKKEKKQPSNHKTAVKKSSTEKPVPQQSTSSPSSSQGGNLRDFLPLVGVMLRFMNAFRKKIAVNYFLLKLILSSDDPCDLAINYGRAWAAIGSLLPQLERVLTIKNRDIEVECDFADSETTIEIALDLTITIGRLLGLTVVYGFYLLKEFLVIRKKRKGGVTA